MIGQLLGGALKMLGRAGSFVNTRLLAGSRPGMIHGPTRWGDEEPDIALSWLAGTAKDAGKAMLFLGSMGTSVLGATKAMEAFSNSLIERRRELSMFHGGIASSFARLDAQQLSLDLRRAQATAPGVMRLNEAVQAMREDTLGARILLENLWNSVGTGLATVVSFVSESLQPTVKMLRDALVRWGITEPPDANRNRLQGDLLQFLEQMQSGQFGQPISQRPGRNGRL